ncbi:MAG TPA: DUF2784 domain-containing protein [Pyrinomonadaceae bacterium]|jgi:hypothetical protein
MFYRLIADIIFIFHFCFVFFTIFGGLLVLRWRWIWKFHLLCVVWGALVQYFLWVCPLTSWENYFRELGGEAGYEGGFVEYYVTVILYSSLSPQIHLVLGGLLIAFNLFVYSFVLRQKQR